MAPGDMSPGPPKLAVTLEVEVLAANGDAWPFLLAAIAPREIASAFASWRERRLYPKDTFLGDADVARVERKDVPETHEPRWERMKRGDTWPMGNGRWARWFGEKNFDEEKREEKKVSS